MCEVKLFMVDSSISVMTTDVSRHSLGSCVFMQNRAEKFRKTL